MIDIGAGVHILGVGWRGDGTVLHDPFHCGPCEFELLHAAGMTVDIPQMNHAASAGLVRASRKTWWIEEIVGISRGHLIRPITSGVIGYRRRMPDVTIADASFADPFDIVTECYEATRAADGEADSSVGITSFALHA